MSEPNQTSQLEAELRKVINTHGHGFHYAVLRRAATLRAAKESPWVLSVAEFPFVVNGETGHIDFVLRNEARDTYLVAECKRADPATARWCFARAPYTWREATGNEVVFDQLRYEKSSPLDPAPVPRIAQVLRDHGPYHIGHELKTGRQGDGTGQGRQGINNAVTQVLRGSAGFINYIFSRKRWPDKDQFFVMFVPVVFTTAELWVTDVDLGAADVASGNLASGDLKLRREAWIWFTHNRSPSISHAYPASSSGDDFSEELRREFARTVAIVTPDGLDDFIGSTIGDWLL